MVATSSKFYTVSTVFFIKTEEKMLLALHTFLCSSQPRSLLNWIMETRDMPNQLGLFYVFFITFPLYIQCYQFNIFQITLTTPSHWFTSNFMLVFKRLHLNLFNIVFLKLSRSLLGITLPESKQFRLYLNQNSQSQHSKKQEYCGTNFMCRIKI